MQSGRTIAGETLIRAAVYAGVAFAALLVLTTAEVLLVIFAGVLFAILFDGIGRALARWTGITRRWGLLLGLVIFLAVLAVATWLVAPDVSIQASELAERLPRAVSQLEAQARQYDWLERLLDQRVRLDSVLPDGSNAVGLAARFFSSTFGALGNLVIALALGLFLALDPAIYVRGLLHLVPLHRRERALEVLRATGEVLESWLLAKLVAMLVIGVATAVGLGLLNIDLALVLGLIAAVLSFVPNIGPVVAMIPAALIALIGGADTVLYVVLLYTGVQAVESYVLTPMLQQRMVDLPPALTIAMQVLMGVLAGILGVILAAPLAAAAMTMIRMWYVEDLLGDRSAAP